MASKTNSAYRPEPKCKICKLYAKNLELWQKIHIKILEDALARSSVCDWANSQIEILNHQYILNGEAIIPKLNEENFHNHFNKHVSENLNELWMLKTKAENTSASRGYGTVNNEQAQMAGVFVTGLVANGGHLNTFITMQTMVDALKMQINAYTQYFQNYAEDNPGKIPDIKMIEVYQRLVAGYLQSEQELMKIKNSGEITGKAIEEALWKIVSDLSNKIREVSETVKLRLSDILPNTSIPIEIENLIRQEFVEHAKMVVPDIINKVKKDYKLQ
jgi:hypothetical protein